MDTSVGDFIPSGSAFSLRFPMHSAPGSLLAHYPYGLCGQASHFIGMAVFPRPVARDAVGFR
ncbi:MAG: hypothetical protein ACI9NC_005260 [Verrucomicrobiales bacterium]|jgi:hypothetical protein